LFEEEKIKNAVMNAMKSAGVVDTEMAEKIARITRKSIFREDKDTSHMWMKFTIWWRIN
jgi:hypothetical protein